MDRTVDPRWPRPDQEPMQVAAWLAGYALLHLRLLVVGLLAAILVTEGSRAGLWVIGALWFALLFYGFYVWLPTLVMLVVVGVVGLLAPASVFRATALVGFPLIVVAFPVESPPSSQYGAQLLFMVPVQVAFALLLRRPEPEPADSDHELLAAWGLTGAGAQPRPEPLARPDRPSRWWYAALLGVLAWLALLLTGGRPLLVELTPLDEAVGLVDIAILSLPVLGMGQVACARGCARHRPAMVV